MSIIEPLRREMEHECGVTRELLTRVPEDQLDWRPHEKSSPLRQLVSHLASIPKLVPRVLNEPGLDIDPNKRLTVLCKAKSDLLEMFDQEVAAALAAMRDVADPPLMDSWSLKFGGQTVYTMPRASVLRMMVLNHSIHHRGQLTVYYRLLGVPLPSVYGPTADDMGPFKVKS